MNTIINGSKSYFKYLTDTLGIKYFDFVEMSENVPLNNVVIESNITSKISWELGFESSSKNHLLFLLNADSWESIDPELKELFLKIRAAMKLNSNIQAPAVVAKWNSQSLNELISKINSPVELILFEDDNKLLEPAIRVIGDQSLVVVPSLSLMVKKQEFKKNAWERIKILALKLNQKS